MVEPRSTKMHSFAKQHFHVNRKEMRVHAADVSQNPEISPIVFAPTFHSVTDELLTFHRSKHTFSFFPPFLQSIENQFDKCSQHL
jgi:hypothetical protein